MTKVKKLILGLGITLMMLVSMSVGIGVFKPNTNVDEQLPEIKRDYFAKYRQESVTYTFDHPVETREGTPTIEYSYNPDNNVTSGGVVAYEYVFNNPNQHTIGINLHKIEADGVNISYAYLYDGERFDITSGTAPYEMPTITEGQSCRIYIIVSPEAKDIPANFTADIDWDYGKPGKLVLVADIEGYPLEIDIIKGSPVKQLVVPDAPNGYYFDGWATDEKCERLINDSFTNQGGTLYARYANLPTDWLELVEDEWWVVTGSSNLPANLVIPNYYNGLPVVGIVGDSEEFVNSDFGIGVFMSQTGLTSVNLPETFRYIGAGAFVYCTNIASINFPDNIETIGLFAFGYCVNLTSIKLPKNLTALLPWTFVECSNITYVDASYTNITTITGRFMDMDFGSPFECVEYKSNLQLINLTGCNNLTSIGYAAFSACDSLTSITIPGSVTTIEDEAFSWCDSLTNIEFGTDSQLTTIGDSAFRDCRSLTSITIPDSVTTIGDWAFNGCSSLTSVTFDNPNGWVATDVNNSSNIVNLSATDLANTSTSATYLKSTYYNYIWTKN